MLNRLALVLVAMFVCAAYTVSTTGCAHPYSAKPDKLRKPRKKKRPKVEKTDEAANEIKFDEECRVNFHDDKRPKRRQTRAATTVAKSADVLLLEAADLEGEARILRVIDAINKLKNALRKDQFSGLATYKLAVAYALVQKKGCSLRVLERLNDLQKMPEAARAAELSIKRALQDQAFDLFRKDADAAMGE